MMTNSESIHIRRSCSDGGVKIGAIAVNEMNDLCFWNSGGSLSRASMDISLRALAIAVELRAKMVFFPAFRRNRPVCDWQLKATLDFLSMFTTMAEKEGIEIGYECDLNSALCKTIARTNRSIRLIFDTYNLTRAGINGEHLPQTLNLPYSNQIHVKDGYIDCDVNCPLGNGDCDVSFILKYLCQSRKDAIFFVETDLVDAALSEIMKEVNFVKMNTLGQTN